MTWGKFTDIAHLHRKSQQSGLDGFGFWVASVLHCNLHHTDGRIEKSELVEIWPHASPARLRTLAKRMVQLNRWHDHGDHWMVHDYEHHQEEALRVFADERREYERLRKKVQREKARAKRIAELAALSRGDSPGPGAGTSPRHVRGTSQGTDPPSDRGQPPAPPAVAAPVVSPPPVPSRPVPSRPDPVREGPHTPDDDGPPYSAEALKLLAELRSHKCLAPVATAEIAQQLATNGWTAGKSVDLMLQAIRELAGKAGVDAAAGHPWDVGALRSKLVGFVMRARPAPVDAPRGGTAPAPAARPEAERIDVAARRRAKEEGRARLRSTGTEGGGE